MALPSSATGTPFSKLDDDVLRLVGRVVAADLTNWKASSGGATQGSSSTPHSLLRPHRFSSIE